MKFMSTCPPLDCSTSMVAQWNSIITFFKLIISITCSTHKGWLMHHMHSPWIIQSSTAVKRKQTINALLRHSLWEQLFSQHVLFEYIHIPSCVLTSLWSSLSHMAKFSYSPLLWFNIKSIYLGHHRQFERQGEVGWPSCASRRSLYSQRGWLRRCSAAKHENLDYKYWNIANLHVFQK